MDRAILWKAVGSVLLDGILQILAIALAGSFVAGIGYIVWNYPGKFFLGLICLLGILYFVECVQQRYNVLKNKADVDNIHRDTEDEEV